MVSLGGKNQMNVGKNQMSLGKLEFFAMNNFLRRWIQRHKEMPPFKKMLKHEGINLSNAE